MLSQAERLAGRAFRTAQRLRLASLPAADVTPSQWVHHYRHECEARGGQSTSFEMREVYIPSPGYFACSCGELVSAAETVLAASVQHQPGPGCQLTEVEPGRLAFVYREGRCTCGLTGRSHDNRVVDARERAPLGRT